MSLCFESSFWKISHLLSFSDILHYRKVQTMAGTKKTSLTLSWLWLLFLSKTFSGLRYNSFQFFPTVQRLRSPCLLPVVRCEEDSYRYLFPSKLKWTPSFLWCGGGMVYRAWGKRRLGVSDLQLFLQRSTLPHDWSTVGAMSEAESFGFLF